MGRGVAKYAIVAVNYFTKWVEAEPLTKVSSAKVINFMIRNVLCRYVVPQKIILDNGLQFDSEEFADWCQEYGIAKSFSAIAYPQGEWASCCVGNLSVMSSVLVLTRNLP